MAKDRADDITAEILRARIDLDNWERLQNFVETYNRDPLRMTAMIDVSYVFNMALSEFLQARAKEAESTFVGERPAKGPTSVDVEIAPGVRFLLEDHIHADAQKKSDNVQAALSDVIINLALDRFLSSRLPQDSGLDT